MAMIKTLGIILSFGLFLCSCKTAGQTDERKKLIKEFISAAENYDTLQLFALVDTSNYFSLQGKDEFLFKIALLKERLKECDSMAPDSAIKIHPRNIPITDYTYSFCRGKRGEITGNSFEIQFSFADFDAKRKIYFFDVIMPVIKGKPTIAPGQVRQ